MLKIVTIENEKYIKTSDGKIFEISNLKQARFHSMFICIERYIYKTSHFPMNEDGWIYIDDEYLFELYKIYFILNIYERTCRI